MKNFALRRLALLGALCVLSFAYCAGLPVCAAPIPDFTFIQVSDVHTPMEQSKEVLSKIGSIGEVDLKAYGVVVPKPSFAIATGDLTEFGGGSGWWEIYLSYWKGSGLPVYNALGNHDNTWHSGIKALRDIGQGPYYSFDQFGCHFVSLMSPSIQDPRPSFGEEQILWLAKDLKKVGPETPVFVYFHHPLLGSEFASKYDSYRLLDTLRPYNIALLLVGHGHSPVYHLAAGLDQVMGGSTFGPHAGLCFVSVKDQILRVAYQRANQTAPVEKLLEKPLATRSTYPKIEIMSPKQRQVTGTSLELSAKISGAPDINSASYTIDDEQNGELSLSGAGADRQASATVDLKSLLPGAHYVRVIFKGQSEEFTHSAEFFLEKPSPATAWRQYLGASSKVTPTIDNGIIYVGSNNGILQAFQAATGKPLWSVTTGAEILAQPLAVNDTVVTANGLGVVAAYKKGKQVWSFTAGDSVYSSPVLVDGKVVFGCNDGKLYALDAKTGSLVWKNEDATYTIESKPFVSDGKIYYGAWDQYVRCVDAKDGTLIWKQICEGSKTQSAKRYYSPGDAMPVVVEGKVFIADRNYMLTIIDAVSGARIDAMNGISAEGISADGKYAYLRKNNGELVKVDSSGKPIWSVPAELGAIPAAPVEVNGIVYVASGKGKVSAVSAADGKIVWQYQASPQLFVMSSMACDGKNVYVTAFDGTLTAIKAH